MVLLYSKGKGFCLFRYLRTVWCGRLVHFYCKTYKDLFKIEFKHSIFFFSLMRLLSPLYISLTVSISSDTINYLALVSLTSRLLFHNYSSGRYTAFSLNSGLFGAILLEGIRQCLLHGRVRSGLSAEKSDSPWNPDKASRLKSQNDAVFIILLGLLCFRRSPIKAKTSESTNRNLFWAVGLFSAHILQTIPSVTCLFHLITQFLFCFVGPFLLTSVFIKHKNNLYGIWDEAEMNLDQ